MLFSRLTVAGFEAGLEDDGESLAEDGRGLVSSTLSSVFAGGADFSRGRLVGTVDSGLVLAAEAAGGGGRAPVLRYYNCEPLSHIESTRMTTLTL